MENGVETFDGYTYSIAKPNLLAEISRRVKAGDARTRYEPRNSTVVKVPMELWKKVRAQQTKCINTNEEVTCD